MKITKVNLPSQSILPKIKYDYEDSYQGIYLDSENLIKSKDIGKAFFTSAPDWTDKLFELRNKIVSLFGLKTPEKISNKQELLDNFNCEPNEQLGIFKVFDKTENEVILGEDDRHLDFRISLLKEKKMDSQNEMKLTISTTVKFNNWLGKLYFIPVKPFHKLIVTKMLKGIIINIGNKAHLT